MLLLPTTYQIVNRGGLHPRCTNKPIPAITTILIYPTLIAISLTTSNNHPLVSHHFIDSKATVC